MEYKVDLSKVKGKDNLTTGFLRLGYAVYCGLVTIGGHVGMAVVLLVGVLAD